MAINSSSTAWFGNNLPATTTMIDLPFRISDIGKVSYVADTDHKAWRNKVVTLLSIEIDERIWYHNFGVNVNSLLFQNSSSALMEARGSVEEAFIKWAPELTFKDVESFYDKTTGVVTLNIIYQVPTGEVDSVKISTESLTSAGEIIEVL